jgi:hypothetical protein
MGESTPAAYAAHAQYGVVQKEYAEVPDSHLRKCRYFPVPNPATILVAVRGSAKLLRWSQEIPLAELHAVLS